MGGVKIKKHKNELLTFLVYRIFWVKTNTQLVLNSKSTFRNRIIQKTTTFEFLYQVLALFYKFAIHECISLRFYHGRNIHTIYLLRHL